MSSERFPSPEKKESPRPTLSKIGAEADEFVADHYSEKSLKGPKAATYKSRREAMLNRYASLAQISNDPLDDDPTGSTSERFTGWKPADFEVMLALIKFKASEEGKV